MVAFKGFNKNLECTRGRGTYRYEVGKTYQTEKAECALTGFHCVEEPIEVLSWYNNPEDRYCIVEALGDIHEDGYDRISCTEIRITKEINRIQLALLETKWLQKHASRKYSKHVKKDIGQAEMGFVIVRGKNPKAQGKKGDYLFLLKEEAKGHEIAEIGAFLIDGEEIKENTYYRVTGKEARREKSRIKKA